MLDSPWVLGGALLVIMGAAGALTWRLLRSRRGWWRVPVAVITAIVVGGLALQVWARLSLDHSTIARAIVWMDADVDDWQRFPSSPVPAGDEVLELQEGSLPDGTLDEVTRSDGETEDLSELLERTESTSFLVLRGDELLVEEYPLGGERDDIATSFSMAKSVLSTALGIAIARGEVGSLDDPITDYVPELADEDERFAQITLRHLVTMSSGLRYEEAGLPWSDDAVTYYSPDLRETAMSAEVVEEPGRTWLYNNYNPLLVGLALERATGALPAYVSEHLWQPMGAEYDASWSIDSEEHGFAKMESGFNARPVDYARFGYLFAHEGTVDGRQVVPADWVADATANDAETDPAEHYQHFWWVDTTRPGRFLASGNKGQYIYVDPAADVVVVRTGRDFGIDDWTAVLADITDRVLAAG